MQGTKKVGNESECPLCGEHFSKKTNYNDVTLPYISALIDKQSHRLMRAIPGGSRGKKIIFLFTKVVFTKSDIHKGKGNLRKQNSQRWYSLKKVTAKSSIHKSDIHKKR